MPSFFVEIVDRCDMKAFFCGLVLFLITGIATASDSVLERFAKYMETRERLEEQVTNPDKGMSPREAVNHLTTLHKEYGLTPDQVRKLLEMYNEDPDMRERIDSYQAGYH